MVGGWWVAGLRVVGDWMVGCFAGSGLWEFTTTPQHTHTHHHHHLRYDEAQRRNEVNQKAKRDDALKGHTFKPMLATASTKAEFNTAGSSNSEGNFGDRYVGWLW